MCSLCFLPGSRPRVYVACEACHGAGAVAGAVWPCPACHGRGCTSHTVSFDCDCDGCREFRGEPHPGPVAVNPLAISFPEVTSL